jgi:hypothetical protein
MEKIMDTLFGPLPKEYCGYFYYISIFVYIAFLLALISFITLILKERPKNFYPYVIGIIGVLSYFFFYLQNRILYSMCIHSL